LQEEAEGTLLHKMDEDCHQKMAEIMKLMDEEKQMLEIEC
jgi:hypothetical protein